MGFFTKSDGTDHSAGAFQLGLKERVRYEAKATGLELQASDTIELVSSYPKAALVLPDETAKPGTIASGFIEGGEFQAGVTISCTITRADKTQLVASGLVDVVDKTLPRLSLILGG
jgi:hypothetical protein